MYATGRLAIAFCDRCGRRVPYLELRPQVINQIATNLQVCEECVDIDQEQIQVGRMITSDPQALLNARPDLDRLVSRGLFGWNPALGTQITILAGTGKAV